MFTTTKSRSVLAFVLLVLFASLFITPSSLVYARRVRRTPTPTPTITPTSIPSTTPTVVPTILGINKEAWIYPGSPACNASVEYTSRNINTIKMEYATVGKSGIFSVMTEAAYGCNGYSAANAASIKAHSQRQLVTISGSLANYRPLITNATTKTTFISKVVAFVNTTGFTGVDIDFEEFGSWTASDYALYKTFLNDLGTALHANGKTLSIDIPAIDSTTSQGWYKLKYEDLNALPVDEFTIMAYDYDMDYTAGTPIQPLAWINTIATWGKSKFVNFDKVSIGIPAYGYAGTCGGYNISNYTLEQMKTKPGFATATRDALSGEMKWKSGTMCYDYNDTTSLDLKLKAATDAGFKAVSVWHLGGNSWFSN